MAVSKRLRYEVLRRDDHACRYCGARAPDVKLTVDHVLPTSLGGQDAPENLVAACSACNAGKSSSSPDAPLVANVADDALRWARAMALAADLAHAQRIQREDDIENFDVVWTSYFNDEQIVDLDCFRDRGWQDSISRFLDAGLSLHDLVHFAEVKLRSGQIRNTGVWKYFCGTCWRVLKDRQETASAIIKSGEDC